MKTIIAGSRTITDYEIVKKAIIQSEFKITEIVSGRAEGVDILGEKYADENNIPKKLFEIKKEDWKKYGKAAGPLRNNQMADYAEALIAIWDGISPGTKQMIQRANKKGLKVFVLNV